MRKLKLFFTSVLCLIVGLSVGFVGNIFLTLPESYVIPEKIEDICHVDSYQTPNKIASSTATTETGAHIIENSDISIHFLELGNRNTGDCIYIKVKNGDNDTDILVDGGSKTTSIPYITDYIDNYLTDNVLDFVIITHAHEDHYAGFSRHSNTEESLFDHYRKNGKSTDTIITFAQSNKDNSAKIPAMHQNYLLELGEAINSGAKCVTALNCVNEETTAQGHQAHNIYTLGTDSNDQEITMYILNQKYYTEHSATENNYSVCFQIVQGTKKYLFTGDLEAEREGESSLIEMNPGLLSQVELYKAGHHGSKTSSSAALMEIIRPKTVVVCCCAGSSEYTTKNENQFPTQIFINNVTPYTDQIFVTSLCIDYNENKFQSFNGNITVCSTGTNDISVICSNSTTVLQDTDWFKQNRTLPENAYRTT